MKYTEKLQINVTKENCDYYIEITAGIEHIKVWLRKKNTFDYWTVKHPSEELKMNFDIIEDYVLKNFDKIVKELTGEDAPEGTAASEKIISAITGPDEEGYYMDALKEYTAFGYNYYLWMCKTGTDKRIARFGYDTDFPPEAKEYEFEAAKKDFTCLFEAQD